MRKIIVALVLCLLPVVSHADVLDDVTSIIENTESWTTADTIRQAAFLGLSYVNYEQVKHALYKSEKYNEYGMTDQPSVGTVGTAFLIGAVVHTGVALALPPEYREKWQWVGIGIQAGVGVYAVALSVQLK